jgi:hypothetical protein
VGSDNPTGGDNQQETAFCSSLELDPRWVSGFADGEGCFCVSIHKNPTYARRSFGWQLHPVFQVSQHRDHRAVLEALVEVFGCGRVRPKGPTTSVEIFAVDSLHDIREFVLPFFERFPLHVKHDDFERFRRIVAGLLGGEHFTPAGFERLVRLAYAMNAHGKQRARSIEQILGSSETVRQACGHDPQ